MKYFNIQSSPEGQYFNLTGDEGVRRIICNSTAAQTSRLEVNGNVIGSFNNSNDFELTFESYYGYPKLSDFSIFQFGFGSILVDTVPYNPISHDYFEEGVVSW